MTRADLIERIVRLTQNIGTLEFTGTCAECEDDVDLSIDVDQGFAEALLDELDREGLEIVKK